MFGDPKLNELEERVNISNQNIALADANFRAARALVKEARSQYFPLVTTAPDMTISQQSAALGRSTFSSQGVFKVYSVPFSASWEPDLWRRVRNTVSASTSQAQATAGDLENVRLTVQSELAFDYFEVRSLDAQKQLLDSTVAAFQKALELTHVLYQTGIDSDEDVSLAETQLETTQAQATDILILRAQLEHAIALLAGRPASTFSIPFEPLKSEPPAIPLGLPSQLLERRPDIAAAERRVAAANAQIGVARAAFFPSLTLSAAAGFQSSMLGHLVSWPSRFWSIGPAFAETLFDAGRRGAVTQQAEATYDFTVATYRQDVLLAFGEVEDNLAALRILADEARLEDTAIEAAQRSVDLALNRYRGGVTTYLEVITAQNALLANQTTAIGIRVRRMTASVLLVKALGGGWD